MLNKIWGVIASLAAVGWLLNLIDVIQNKPLDKFTLIVACVITGGVCVRWAWEAFNEE